MEKKKVVKALEDTVIALKLEPEFRLCSASIAEYIYKQLDILKWQLGVAKTSSIEVDNTQNTELPQTESNDIVNEFVDRMYALYPTKCPKRNASLGKSRKDKVKIKRLLKTYSQEEIERVIRAEVEEKYGKQYMQNFSTFINNFPDIDAISSTTQADTESKTLNNTLVIGGVVYK